MNPRAALAWSFAERYASFAIGLVGTMLLARLLTPAQVGVFSMCAAITAMLGIVRDFGTSEYLIQARELDRARYRAAVGVVFASAWALALALWAGAPALARAFDEPSVATVMRVLALQFALFPLTAPLFALLNREMAFRRIFVLQLSCNAVQTATSLALAWAGWGSLALAWGVVANIGTQTVLLGAWAAGGAQLAGQRAFDLPRFERRSLREVLRFGLPYTGSRGLETGARNAHELVIARSFDFASVGLFSRAYGMVEMFHSNVADAVVRVATPAFAEAHRQGQPLGAVLVRAVSIYVAVAWPFFAFVAIAAPEIIRVLFGPQWGTAAPLATLLALAALPAALYELLPQLLSATGHVVRRLKVTLWAAPVHIVAVVLASLHSLWAVAAVFSATSLFTLVLFARQLRAAVGLGGRWIVAAGGPAAVVAAASAAAMAAVAGFMRQQGAPAVIVLALTALAGLLAWLACARGLNHPAHHEIQGLWRRFRGARAR